MSNTEPTEAQIVAAAQVLNKRHATLCNVNEADSWAIQGDDFREDARAALVVALAQQPAASGEPVAWQLPGSDSIITAEAKAYRGVLAENWTVPLYAAPQPAPARVPLTDDPWHNLYRRAINEANGLTNYVEDRPELRSAERRLAAIEAEARALAAAPTAQQEPARAEG